MSTDPTLEHLPDFYGHRETIREGRPVWTDKSPIPWMTYPAICYLNQLDLRNSKVFEYGCGQSTLYWAGKSGRVISVENDAGWFEKMRNRLPPSAEVFLGEGRGYVEKVRYLAPHDVIVIDGRWRFDCAMECLPHLSPGGMVILDNSERYPLIAEFFRGKGLIQVDMIGYGPQNRYIWATSFFLTRGFNVPPAGDIQPRMGPGMIDSIEARPEYREANKAGSRT